MRLLAISVVAASIGWASAQDIPVPVGSFDQQVQVSYTKADGLPSNDARTVAQSGDGTLYAAFDSGVVGFRDGTWKRVTAFDGHDYRLLAPDARGTLAATEDEVYLLKSGKTTQVGSALPGLIHYIYLRDDDDIWVATEAGLFTGTQTGLKKDAALGAMLETSQAVQYLALSDSEAAVATADGLFVNDGSGWKMVLPRMGEVRWAPVDVRVVAYDNDGRLWFGCPQGVGYREADGEWKLFTGADGLPYNDFTCMCAGPKGVWFGTTNGAIRYDDGVWEFRAGRRWLVNNEVRDIAIAPNGDAWIATAGGVSCIAFEPMTLAKKAAYYEDEIDKYHRRTPFGYVTNANMSVPGDKSDAEAFVTDNDGQYTGLYLGSASLGYAATKDPELKKEATAAFEALAFLSEVTQGGEHPAPKGFIARAIMPTDGPDPNKGDNPERDRKKQANDDGLWKILDPRWPVDATGDWYWKTDTSSDELDGHFFGYGIYYDRVCETEAEKERCREVVARVADHLIEHNFRLVDHDGTPTRWAHFAPEDLNGDDDWWAERGLNSLSLLTYLSIAHHVTGDPKYREVYMDLAKEHFYALNGMVMPKLQAGPGSFVQFDDKMAFMNFYHLIRYETDPELLSMYYNAIYYYWSTEKYELNPFFNFVYAACCLGKVRTDHWGDLDISPTGPWLEQSIDTLKRYPMDLCDWKMSNSHRIDILPLPEYVREPGENEDKGYRYNGYVLPIDEGQSLSWSEDRWALTTGGNGTRLRDGCPYLLAYYMGLVHGYIE